MNRIVLALAPASVLIAACGSLELQDGASLTFSTGGATGSVFVAASHCLYDAQSDRYHACGGLRQADFATGAVSPTTNETVKSLAFESSVVATFFCSALGVTGVGAPYTHGSEFGVIAPTPTTILNNSADVPYAGGVFHLEFNPAGKVFRPGCELEVTANVTYPPVATLEIYASGLRKLQRKLARVYEDVTPGIDQVEAIEAMDEGIETLGLLLDLQTSPITKRKIEDAKARLETARGAVSFNCGGGGANLCTQTLADARQALAADVEAAGTEITQLRTFVDAEATRLQAVAGAFAEKIAALTRASACLDVSRPIGEVCH
jgi:hypothetical protein